MAIDNKDLVKKQIAFGYGIALSILLGSVGIIVIWVVTDNILDYHNDMIKAKQRLTNETYLQENQYKPGAAEDEIWFYEHAYNLSRQTGQTFIPVGVGLLVLAETIAYVPISLYAENGRELLKDHSPEKR